MNRVSEQTERLINRYLDGEITPAEHATLQDVLRVDPAARRLMDEYRDLDASARGALREVCVGGAPLLFEQHDAHEVRSGGQRWPFPTNLAAAAAVALMVGAWWFGYTGITPPQHGLTANELIHAAGLGAWRPSTMPWDAFTSRSVEPERFTDPALLVDFIDSSTAAPRKRDRRLDREWIGIVEDENTIYLMEFDRRETRVVPVSADF
jgi:hypothetical protein